MALPPLPGLGQHQHVAAPADHRRVDVGRARALRDQPIRDAAVGQRERDVAGPQVAAKRGIDDRLRPGRTRKDGGTLPELSCAAASMVFSRAFSSLRRFSVDQAGCGQSQPAAAHSCGLPPWFSAAFVAAASMAKTLAQFQAESGEYATIPSGD